MKKVLLGGFALVAWIGGGAANAADMPLKAPPMVQPTCAVNDITRSNNQVSVDGTATYIQYGPEYLSSAPGTPLDKETGWVPGLAVTGSAMFDSTPNSAVGCNTYLWGRFTWMDGNTQYYGALIGGPYGSLIQTDGAKVADLDFRIGKGFGVSPNVMLTPYFGIGTNSWTRLLTGPSGYQEIYGHDYAGGGLLLQWSPAPRWVLSANGLVGYAFNSSMTASPIPGGAAIPLTTFTLGNNLVYMAGGAVDYAFTDHWHGNVGIDYSYFAYSQSPPVGGLLEPNSKTSYLTLSAGLGFAW